MFPAGITKVRLCILIIFCIVVWRTSYYFSQVKTLQLAKLTDSNEKESDKDSNKIVVRKPILVTVYFEALCSDSRNFILKQLVPTYEKLQDLIKIDLVPYGKATTIEKDDTYLFECQHSYIECEANKVHACVLNQSFSKEVSLRYVACMIKDNMVPHDAGQKCADELRLDYNPILECANGLEGSRLLKEYGDRTHAVRPKITFIPTIQINESSDVPLVHLLKNLFKEICNMFHDNFPEQCL